MLDLLRIKELSLGQFNHSHNLWKQLHQYPELSFKEYETSKRIAAELDGIGIPYKRVMETGIIGVIEGYSSGLTIGIRAELDGLPISEDSGLDYSSRVPNAMHACGHDVHMANLIGVAKILWELRSEFQGKILLIFQPGEELLPGGAKGILNSSFFQQNFPDIMLGLHILPEMPVGEVGFRSGSYMASGDEVYLTVKGKGGHAALPHTLVDPVLIASHIVVALQQLVSRKSPSSVPSVLSFGKVLANGANNVIPNLVTLEGTFRTMDEKWRAEAHEHIVRISQGIAASMEGECIVDIKKGYPVLVNDVVLTKQAISLAQEFMGQENVVDLPIRMTTDDFAYYANAIPSVYFRMGSGSNKKQPSSLHSSKLVVEESFLEFSVGITLWMIIRLLANSDNISKTTS